METPIAIDRPWPWRPPYFSAEELRDYLCAMALQLIAAGNGDEAGALILVLDDLFPA